MATNKNALFYKGCLLNLAGMNKSLLSFFAITTLFLSGCQTLEGIQQDLGSVANSISSRAAELTASDEKAEATTILAEECPDITIDPQLDSMTEFYDTEQPSDETKVSEIRIVRTASKCESDNEYLTMRIDMAFEGSLGPKARRKEGDRPFFAYPYFIAVTDGQGNELARELFAASVTYDADQENMTLVDTIRQRLPLNDDGSLPDYQIQIGFQLTENQLFYNASL